MNNENESNCWCRAGTISQSPFTLPFLLGASCPSGKILFGSCSDVKNILSLGSLIWWALLDSAVLRFPSYTLKHLRSSTVSNFCKRIMPVIMLVPQPLYFRAFTSSTLCPLASQTSTEMGGNWIGMTIDKPSPTLCQCLGFELIGCLYLLANDFWKTSQGLFLYSSNMDVHREIATGEKKNHITSTVSVCDLQFWVR